MHLGLENISDTLNGTRAIASCLDADKSRTLPAFHTVTGCDTVSFFGWKGKLKAWNTWTAFPTVTSAFLELDTEKANLSQDAFEKVQQFVVFMYKNNYTATTVNAVRPNIFSQRCKDIALRQNTLVAAYHAFVWGQCLQEHQSCHLHPPGDGPRTKDDRGSHCGQHFARLRTRATR